jgi:chemotaxis protein methyltransferase CheR
MIEIKATDQQNWTSLKKRICDLKIFNTQNYTDTFLTRRIECRLRVTGQSSYSAYIKLLESSSAERESLLKELTINVTNFFRDKQMYHELQDQIIPALIAAKEKNNDRMINVWSAGCSSGEEPYSVAMLFKEALGAKLSRFHLNITATDIDHDAISDAKKAIYNEHQLKETDQRYLKYFEKTGQDYLVTADIRNMVNLKEGDILSDSKPKNIDIILCRNTVIYFNVDTKSKLYVDFYNCLNPAGYLVLGKTEVLIGPARELFTIINNSERVYCKSSD